MLFFYLFMPEMKGRYVVQIRVSFVSDIVANKGFRSLEELDEIFAAGVPSRRFKSYRCHIVEEAVSHTKDAEAKKSVAHVERVS